MVACAVQRVGHAAVCAAELDVQVCVAYLVASREQTQRGEENRKGVHERDLAAGSHAGGGRYHILLGYAHVEKALGVSLAEYCALCGTREVCVEHDYVFVRFAQLGKHRTVNFSYLLRH